MTTCEIVNSCPTEVWRYGDLRYTYYPPGYELSGYKREYTREEEVYLSTKGQALHLQGIPLLELGDVSFARTGIENIHCGVNPASAFVTQEFLTTPQGQLKVAVKRIFPAPYTVTALEQFEAMRILQENDYAVATPLLARRQLLVTNWVDGTKLTGSSELFTEYMAELQKDVDQLIKEGLWKPWWQIDSLPNNYVLENPSYADLRKKIAIIDPILHIGTTCSWSLEEMNTHR